MALRVLEEVDGAHVLLESFLGAVDGGEEQSLCVSD
jgi:hypothetical protein